MIGQSVGGYQIVAKLGEGGMGVVYLGEHRRIARKAAIKVLRSDLTGNAEMLERFFNEARATSMIRHPGIVEILDCDVLPDGDAYIAMELLTGESLAAALAREGRLTPARALAVVRQVADALAAAHDRGIVHRDLKPDNLFLAPGENGAGESIKILDFGIAKLTNPELVGGQRMTQTGRLLGTPTYMSPEQCRGLREIDARTDVYALGCILFELVAGRPPFEDAGFGQLVYHHLTTVPPRLRSLEPAAPAGLDDLVARMLAKAPAERPQTMRDVALEIARLAEPARPAGKTPVPIPATVMMFGGPRVATPAAGSRPAPVAAAPPLPSTQTTLRSAASEHVVSDGANADPVDRPARRGALGPLLAVAAAGLVAGVGYWALHARSETPVAGAPALTAKVMEPAPSPSPGVRPPVPAAAPDSPPPAAVAPAAPVPEQAQAEPLPAARPASVRITISSAPSEAEVCLARDHRLLGQTRYEWTAERGARPTKLWIYKAGYRAQQIGVAFDRDSKKHVVLEKLGPDDIADVETCHR